MRGIYATIVLLAASRPVAAQRLDGCVNHGEPGAKGVSQSVSSEDRDRGLQEAGYLLTRDSLEAALYDRQADLRSVAAQKLAEIGGKVELAPIMQAWLAERDGCTEAGISMALSRLAGGLAWDKQRHPDGQRRVTPFQACTPSRPIISLNIQQTTDRYFSGAAVRVSFRNQTSQTLAFVKTASPMDLFSATVLGPGGERAKVTAGKEWMYKPLVHSGSFHPAGIQLIFQPLPPNEDVSWIWRIGEDFDMSVPGTYQVSFGGRIDYLDTTVCSNTLWMTVE
jgi:hypothetical protein